MARPKRWDSVGFADGVGEISFTSWKYFHDYVRQEMLDYTSYVWRGQRDASWKLESSLDRLLNPKPQSRRGRFAKKHLERFKSAVRGRRGPNPTRIDIDSEWWALGQHHGLATPLLDWTESPFVALYFAFEKVREPTSGMRAVWALGPIGKANQRILAAHPGDAASRTLEVIRPDQNENARLVSQAGLFTRGPLGVTVDAWVRENFVGASKYATLLKLVIPDVDRSECLRTLNKMNINHVTLFPDLFGASQHCNKALEIDMY